jgi:hypothetical protein
MAVFPQLGHELCDEKAMDAGREIAQSVLHSQLKPETAVTQLGGSKNGMGIVDINYETVK